MNFYPFSAIFDERKEYTALCSRSGFFGYFGKLLFVSFLKCPKKIIFRPFKAIFNERINMLHFLPVCMQQCVAAGAFFGNFDNNHFLLQNILNNVFLSIQRHFL